MFWVVLTLAFAQTPSGGLPGDVNLTLPDGKSALLRAPAGSYWLSPTATGQWVIQVGSGVSPAPVPPGPTPTPTPTPTPNPPDPTPAPPEPPGPTDLGVARFVFDEVMKLDAPARAKAPIVGQAFGVLSSRIAAGTIGVLKVSSATREAFDAAVGDQKDAWASVDAAMQAELRRLAAAGKIGSLTDLAAAYREIETGCGAVR